MKLISCTFLLLLFPQIFLAQEAQQPTLQERLVRLEEGQNSLEKRFEDLRSEMNARFDDLRFWLQFILGTLVLILGGLIAQWMLLWKRLSQVESRVE